VIFLLGGLGLQDEVLPHNLHARRAGGPGGGGGGARGPVVLVQEAAGVRDVHLGTSRGLLSSGQLGPPPLVGVEPVEPHLAQYQQVHGNLEGATDKELRRSVSQDEVGCLEDVSASPHDDHRETHAVGGLVLEVPVELRDPEHGLGEHGEEADRLHKPGEVQQEIHQYGAQQSYAHNEFQIREEVSPPPEVIGVEVGEVTTLSFLGEELFVVDLDAEMNKSKHGEVH